MKPVRLRFRSGVLPALACAAVALTLVPAAAEAQSHSVTWTEVTRIQLPGDFGALLQAVPGALDAREREHGLHIDGKRLRQDDGASSTILDLEEGRWVVMDHEARTYSSHTFEESRAMVREMAGMMDEVMDEVRDEMEEALAETRVQREEAMAEMRRAMEEAEGRMDLRVDARSTGERRSLAGYPAERHLITAELDLEGEVQGVEEGEGGTLVFLVELWQSDEFPDSDALYEEWARGLSEDPEMEALGREIAASLEPVVGDLGPEALASWDPRIAAGLDRLADLAESLQGRTLLRTVNVAVVPQGAELDEGALLAWEPDSMGDRLRAEAGEAAGEAARDAARQAIGGFFGRGGGDEEEEEEEAPEVRPLLRLITEIREVRETGTPSGDLYRVDPDYTEQVLPALEGPGEDMTDPGRS